MGLLQMLAMDREQKITFLRDAVKAIQSPDGVDFSPETGVSCPLCQEPLGKKNNVKRVLAWKDGVRTRYHECCQCHLKFKSIEAA